MRSGFGLLSDFKCKVFISTIVLVFLGFSAALPVLAQPGGKPPVNVPAEKQEKTEKAEKHDTSSAPLTLSIHPLKSIYGRKEGVTVEFVLKASRPTKICLEKDPLTQFQLQISRGGKGALPLEPLVTTDTRELYFEKIRLVDLKAGDSFPFRANLKRLAFSKGEKWASGDYMVTGVFNLCDQEGGFTHDSAGKEIPIRATENGRFLILE